MISYKEKLISEKSRFFEQGNDIFKEDIVITEFESFKGSGSLNISNTYSFYNFSNAILSDNPKKTGSCFILNKLFREVKTEKGYNSLRSHDCFSWPNAVFLDIDIKSKMHSDIFKKECGVSVDDFFELLKTDPFTYITCRSSSGLGIRSIFFIYSPYLENKNYPINKDLPVSIHKQNFYSVIQYLSKYGLNQKLLKYENILDPSPSRLGLPTFPGRKENSYVNLDCEIFYKDDYNHKFGNDIFKNQKSNISADQIYDISVKYTDELSNLFGHYNASIICSLKGLLSENKIDIFEMIYHLYKKHYKGNGLTEPLSTLKKFYAYIISTKPDYYIPIDQILKRNNIFIDNFNTFDFFENNKDIMFNEYNITYTYDVYLSDIKDKLYRDFQKKKVVLKAEAGGGKSTLLINYLYSLQTGEKIIVYAAPKNAILEQIRLKPENKYIKFQRNYGGFTDKKGDIILSSFESLYKIKNIDVLVVDECHILTTYAEINDKPEEIIIPDCNTIYTSATPEPFLIGEKDYYYINCVKNNTEKPDLKIVMTNDPVSSLIETLNERDSQLVFYNDKKRGEKLMDDLKKQNIKSYQLSSDKKDSIEYTQLINEQILTIGVCIATELVNEGVNFNNNNWDKLFIIDNYTGNYLTHYQVCKRFRKIKDLNKSIFITINKSNEIDLVKYKQSINLNQLYYDEINKQTIIINKINEKIDKNSSVIDDKVYYQIGKKYYLNKNVVKKRILDKFNEIIRNNIYLLKLYYSFYFNIQIKTNWQQLTLKNNNKNDFIKENIQDLYKCANFETNQMKDETIQQFVMGIGDISEYYFNNKNEVDIYIERYKILLKLNCIDMIDKIFNRKDRWELFLKNQEKSYIISTDNLSAPEQVKKDDISIITKNITENMIVSDLFNIVKGKTFIYQINDEKELRKLLKSIGYKIIKSHGIFKIKSAIF